MDLNRAARIATWLCIAALLVLSLVPGESRPHTGFDGRFEHIIAYAGTGFIATLAYRRAILAAGGLALLSCFMEILQIMVPGRSSTVLDAVVSSVGATAGVLVAMAVMIAIAKIQTSAR